MSQPVSDDLNDESAFGIGAESSHDADVTAAYGVGTHVSEGSVGGADGGVENSYEADLRASSGAVDDGPAIIDATGLSSEE